MRAGLRFVLTISLGLGLGCSSVAHAAAVYTADVDARLVVLTPPTAQAFTYDNNEGKAHHEFYREGLLYAQSEASMTSFFDGINGSSRAKGEAGYPLSNAANASGSHLATSDGYTTQGIIFQNHTDQAKTFSVKLNWDWSIKGKAEDYLFEEAMAQVGYGLEWGTNQLVDFITSQTTNGADFADANQSSQTWTLTLAPHEIKTLTLTTIAKGYARSSLPGESGGGEPVPEPTTMATMALGLAGLAGYRRRCQKG